MTIEEVAVVVIEVIETSMEEGAEAEEAEEVVTIETEISMIEEETEVISQGVVEEEDTEEIRMERAETLNSIADQRELSKIINMAH